MTLQELLCAAAMVPIEEMDADELRDTYDTAADLADRLRQRLAELGAWTGQPLERGAGR